MFERILQLIAIFALLLGTNTSLSAQGGAVAAAAAAPAAAGAAGAAAAPRTLWRFLGVPQGFQKVRDTLINRRGNRPRLERKPPMMRIADPANLESDVPAIKKAAEIKKAEDMKLQKIKAIKYLATIGCGCYDKDGEITDALIAATDDCTPDVREAALEAIDDATNGECCRRCGSTSCCNEKINKRLSEIAYERDDTGCPIEPNADIRKLAAKVLKRCCPGGPPTGPIEEDYEEATEESVELIPAPEGETTEAPIGESGEEDEDAIGEGDSSDDIELEDADVEDASGDGANFDDPYEDDASDDSDDLTLNQPAEDNGVYFRFDDANSNRPRSPEPAPLLEPLNRIPTTVQPTPVQSEPAQSVLQKQPAAPPVGQTDSAKTVAKPRLVRRSKQMVVHDVEPVVVAEHFPFVPVVTEPPTSLQPIAVSSLGHETILKRETMQIPTGMTEVYQSNPVVQVAVKDNAHEIKMSELENATRPAKQTFTKQPLVKQPLVRIEPSLATQRGQSRVVAQVVSVNINSGHVILQGTNLENLARKMHGDLYRPTSDGPVKMTSVTVVRVEQGSARVRLTDRRMLEQVQLGDQAIFQ